MTRTLLGDNAKALVVGRDRATGIVTFHPAYLAFCRDWDVQPRACGPYRARTKGKTESGVKYVERNAIAGREFESLAALESHLEEWMLLADAREHGTTHEPPIERFTRNERDALRALPAQPLVVRHRRLRRRVSNDSFVDVDTVRYSVPFSLVRAELDVLVGDEHVEVFQGAQRAAMHRRSSEPYARVTAPSHFDGLWRRSPAPVITGSSLDALGRTLADYEAALEVAS